MSAPGSILQAQLEALLRQVSREQESLSRRARESAEEQAGAIVARARTEARARTREAAAEVRREIERAIADRHAALDTEARRRSQAELRTLMDTAWTSLPETLAAIWSEPDARRRWCRAAAALARRTLTAGGPLAIEFDPALARDPASIARECLGELPDEAGESVELCVEGLGPGLRLRRGLACLDASIPGLLASRERIEADLLAELDRQAGRDRSTP